MFNHHLRKITKTNLFDAIKQYCNLWHYHALCNIWLEIGKGMEQEKLYNLTFYSSVVTSIDQIQSKIELNLS